MILIIDNGSQYTHLIKRNCRDLGHEADILNAKAQQELFEEYLKSGLARVILSGGPKSVYEEPPHLGTTVIEMVKDDKLRIPVLGICYGHQLLAHVLGGNVDKGESAEYGMGEIAVEKEDVIFKGVPKKFRVWVSHYDEVKKMPSGFEKLASSSTCKVEAMKHKELPVFGVQFHPEVWHTEHGEDIIKNFLDMNSEQ